MTETSPPAEAADRFEVEARRTGLTLPPRGRPLDPWLAGGVTLLIILSALTVGYATDWLNPSRAHVYPVAEMPVCGPTPVDLSIPAEAGVSGGLPGAWAALASAYSAATGGCLSVTGNASATVLGALAAGTVDAVVGPAMPAPGTLGNLSAETYDAPLLVAPLVVLYNLGGATPELNLTADALAAIYLGGATSWNDPQLVASNPGFNSTLPIAAAYLAGPTPANSLLSGYLSEWNATFASTVGTGPNVSWPAGAPQTDPSAMLSYVAAHPGAVGYVPTDVCPTVTAPVACATLQDGSDAFVAPTGPSVQAAASLASNSSSALTSNWANVSGVAPVGTPVYPMVGLTYAIVYKDLGTEYGSALPLNDSKWLISLFFWIAADVGGDAASVAQGFGYFALPFHLSEAAQGTALSVTYEGAWILAPAAAAYDDSEGNETGGETGEF